MRACKFLSRTVPEQMIIKPPHDYLSRTLLNKIVQKAESLVLEYAFTISNSLRGVYCREREWTSLNVRFCSAASSFSVSPSPFSRALDIRCTISLFTISDMAALFRADSSISRAPVQNSQTSSSVPAGKCLQVLLFDSLTLREMVSFFRFLTICSRSRHWELKSSRWCNSGTWALASGVEQLQFNILFTNPMAINLDLQVCIGKSGVVDSEGPTAGRFSSTFPRNDGSVWRAIVANREK